MLVVGTFKFSEHVHLLPQKQNIWENVYFVNMVVEKDANHGLVNFDFVLACLII